MQRLRAGFASPHSGGTGAPPGVTRDPCQELAEPRLLSIAGAPKRGPVSNKRCRRCAERRLHGESRAASQGLTCVCRRIVIPHLISRVHLRRGDDDAWLFESLNRMARSRVPDAAQHDAKRNGALLSRDLFR